MLCVDEKSQIQALNRTAPLLPLRPASARRAGRPSIPAQMSHDYQRHAATSLFAALEVVSGKVHGRSYRRHRHQELIEFLNSLAHCYPRAGDSSDLR